MNDDYDVIQVMIRYGGGFVKALGQAATRADSDNLRRIKEAFPEYWLECRTVAGMLRRNRDGAKTSNAPSE